MSHTAQPGAMPSQPARAGVEPTTMTAWVGWIAFAAWMMVILGIFHFFQGLVAIFRDEVYLVGSNGLALSIDYTVWGWAHVIGSIVVMAAGVGLFTGQTWARAVAVVVAALSAVVNVGFLSAYPIWSALMIALDVVVIWAVTVHGGELREQ